MGAIWSQQGCLKLSRTQGLPKDSELKKGKVFKFKKPGHRLYMLDTPMDLVTADWKAKAKVLITEITVGGGATRGKFKIYKLFTKKDAEGISNNLIPYYKFR